MRQLHKLEQVASRAADNPAIRAIRKGMLLALPLTMTGSLILMLLNLPIPAFQKLLLALFGPQWRTVGLWMYRGTFEIMSITAMLSISYYFAEEHKLVQTGEVNRISVILVTAASYLILCGDTDSLIRLDFSGSRGLLVSMLVSLAATSVYLALYKLFSRKPQFACNDMDVLLITALRAFPPALLTILLSAILRLLLVKVGAFEFPAAIQGFFANMAVNGETHFGTAILFILCSHILWFFGMHGSNILDGVSLNLFKVSSNINESLANISGAPFEIFTQEFFDVFVFMGGCGATMGLLIARFLTTGKSPAKRLERIALFPAIFNINEIMVYGIPIIFNPYFLIPFLLAPILMSVTTFLALSSGLVPLTIAQVKWTTPILISGYMCTGSIYGVLLQVVNLAISIGIYYPFAKLYQQQQERSSREIFCTLSQTIQYVQESKPQVILNRTDEVGIHARLLAADIEACISGKIDYLTLEYQPKVDIDGRVVGAEALLRCQHPVYGCISPLILLSVADESELGSRLGRWVIKRAFLDLKSWRDAGYGDIHLSVNVSPSHLQDDVALVSAVRACLAQTGLPPSLIELELTENIAINDSESARKKLDALKQLGVGISIDDFGMGHSSLLYIRDFYANAVKIDRSLVSNVTSDEHSEQIVRTICQLCLEMGVAIVAEGTETPEEVEALANYGCQIFQGYYYSRPLPQEHFLEYIAEHGHSDVYVGSPAS